MKLELISKCILVETLDWFLTQTYKVDSFFSQSHFFCVLVIFNLLHLSSNFLDVGWVSWLKKNEKIDNKGNNRAQEIRAPGINSQIVDIYNKQKKRFKVKENEITFESTTDLEAWIENKDQFELFNRKP